MSDLTEKNWEDFAQRLRRVTSSLYKTVLHADFSVDILDLNSDISLTVPKDVAEAVASRRNSSAVYAMVAPYIMKLQVEKLKKKHGGVL